MTNTTVVFNRAAIIISLGGSIINSTIVMNEDTFSTGGIGGQIQNTIRFGATGTEAAPTNIARRDVDGDGQIDPRSTFSNSRARD